MYILMVDGKYKSYFSNDVFTTIELVNYNVCNTGSYKVFVDACNSEPPVHRHSSCRADSQESKLVLCNKGVYHSMNWP